MDGGRISKPKGLGALIVELNNRPAPVPPSYASLERTEAPVARHAPIPELPDDSIADIVDDVSWPERMEDPDAPACEVIDMAEWKRTHFDPHGDPTKLDRIELGPQP